MNAPLKRTPLFEAHRALGGRIVPFAGWELPVQYAGVVEEHRAVRERAGLFDVSHMGELFLRGSGAQGLVDSLVTNDVGKLPVGKAVYTCGCNEQGTILDDLIVYRVASEEILVVCNAGNLEKMSAHFAKHAQGRCEFRDESADTVLIALQGPRAPEVLAEAGGSPELLALPRFGVARGKVGPHELLVARTGYTGEDGFELFVPNAQGVEVWERLLAAGKKVEIHPVGLGARDTLRLEAALRLYGNDMDETTDPWETGLGWTVKLEGREFLGRSALVERKQRGTGKKLVGIEMVGRGIARHGYPVVDPTATGNVIGQVTSGSPGPSLGRNVGLAFVPTERSAVGSTVAIDIRGKAIEAKVVPLPFYKRLS
ncbi:MAG: glycine cleavage system aminomethyltransferase GcvT [Myxococcales bacterium]